MDSYKLKEVENYLEKSGYGEFLTIEDVFEVIFDEIDKENLIGYQNIKTFSLLIRGSADIFYPDKNGKNHIISRIYAKDYQILGMLKYISEGNLNFQDYYASFSKDSFLIKVKDERREELVKDPNFLYFMLKRMGCFSWKTAEENYLRNVFSLTEFLAFILYNYSENKIYKVSSFTYFASMLKCNRANLYRSLDALEMIGLIEKDEKQIKIKSMEGLKRIFEEKI